MGFFRALLTVTSIATGVAILLELIPPTSGWLVADAAIVCGVATWTYIPLGLAVRWNEKPRSSLESVGALVGMVFATASFSAAGISLAILTLISMPGAGWAWIVIAAIAGFWVAGFTALVVFDNRKRQQETSRRDSPG